MILQILHSIRILFKYRLYTGISLVGLGVAVSSFWFIANYFKHSHQYDAFHENRDRIYRLTMEITTGGSTSHYAATGLPPGALLNKDYTGISGHAKMTLPGDVVVKVNEELFRERDFFSVNSGTLEVFTFHFLTGDRTTCLSNPGSVILSRLLAEKYFGSIDIIDSQIMIGDELYSVKGVFEDWPESSHLKVNALLYSEENTADFELQDWFNIEHYNYVLLDPAINYEDLNAKLDHLEAQHLAALEGTGFNVKLHAQPLSDLYLLPALIGDVPKGRPMYINALAFAGLLVLLIAGMNYINLSLTQSTQRSREIRLKKILGIPRRQLLLQTGVESLIMTLLVLMISAVLIVAFDHLYYRYTGFLTLDLTGHWPLVMVIFLVIFILGLLSTTYSGVYLTFSGRLINRDGASVGTLKKVLLGFQFVMAVVILIATLTMDRQIHFMKNKDLGFSKEQIMTLGLPGDEALKNERIQFRERIKNLATVQSVSLIGGGALPGEDNAKEAFEVDIDGKREPKVYNHYRIDENYFDLLDIQFVAGRNFQADRSSDRSDALIINESLARSLNWQDPIGKELFAGYGGEEPKKVIGVVRNFHNKSLHNVIEPIVFIYDEHWSSNLLVKTELSNMDAVKSFWADHFPETPIELTFFDRFIDSLYTREDHLVKLLSFFSVLSLALCCMGLFAVFSLHVLQKNREMSIRKVLGANAADILRTITGRYAIIALLAVGIAVPVAGFLMDKWLNAFSYKVSLDPLVFIVSTFVVLLAGGVAIMYHVVKVLHVNPVDALKHE